MKKTLIIFVLSVAIVADQLAILCAEVINNSAKDISLNNSFNPKYNEKNIPDTHGIDAELDFYKGNYKEAELIFNKLKNKKDRNLALWSNQLASVYLGEGNQQKAKDALIDAYSLINNIAAFRNLESKAIGLTGEEATKAYKGDPYEKVFNSLYLGLLFYADNDLDNALASFKNGILCDSDVEGNLYKSDVAPLYLLAARIEAERSNKSMSDDYFNKAKEALCLSHPSNRVIVSNEQALITERDEKQKELEKILAKFKKAEEEKTKAGSEKETKKRPKQNFSGRSRDDVMDTNTQKKINSLNANIERINNEIGGLSDKRQENNCKIEFSCLQDLINPNNNVLLCFEMGRGPLKYQIGQYGEIAVFTLKSYKAKKISLLIDNKYKLEENKFMKNNDTIYQALTRGGRMMDCILKGKAQFKQATAQLSYTFSQMSQQMTNQANQMARANPYADNSGAYAAAGVFALFSLAMAIGSEMANPSADARHWSLLPAELQIIPLKLSPGEHHVIVSVYDDSGNILSDLTIDFNINVRPNGGNVFFQRIFERL